MLNRIISVEKQYLKLFNCAHKLNCKRYIVMLAQSARAEYTDYVSAEG